MADRPASVTAQDADTEVCLRYTAAWLVRLRHELTSLLVTPGISSIFLRTAQSGCISSGPDGIILNANQAELEFLGYTHDEYIGRHIAEFHVDAGVIDDILKRLTRKETLKKLRSQAARERRLHQACAYLVQCSLEEWRICP